VHLLHVTSFYLPPHGASFFSNGKRQTTTNRQCDGTCSRHEMSIIKRKSPLAVIDFWEANTPLWRIDLVRVSRWLTRTTTAFVVVALAEDESVKFFSGISARQLSAISR
jgi:hypothetical protein